MENLVMSPKNTWYNGRICTRLLFSLELNRADRLGVVLDSSTGFWMCNRNCRAPDVSFVPRARLEQIGFRPLAQQFFPGRARPGRGNPLAEQHPRGNQRTAQRLFFQWHATSPRSSTPGSNGSRFIILRPGGKALVGPDGFLDGEQLLPGFQFPIAGLFKEWDWE